MGPDDPWDVAPADDGSGQLTWTLKFEPRHHTYIYICEYIYVYVLVYIYTRI